MVLYKDKVYNIQIRYQEESQVYLLGTGLRGKEVRVVKLPPVFRVCLSTHLPAQNLAAAFFGGPHCLATLELNCISESLHLLGGNKMLTASASATVSFLHVLFQLV